MRVIPPFPIISVADWTCNVPENVTTWSAATTYAASEVTKIDPGIGGGVRHQYISLLPGNLNHDPSTSSSWWKFLAEQYVGYNVTVTYGLGDKVCDNITHRNYQSLVAGNVGNLLTDTTKWMDIGPTNSTGAFDLNRGTKTKSSSTLIFTIRPVQNYDMNSLALFGLQATSVVVTVAEFSTPSTYLYNTTFTLTPTNKVWLAYGDWLTGTNGPLYKDVLAIWNLPGGTDVIITITVYNTAGTPGYAHTKLGSIVLGDYVELGGAEYGAVNDSINFSTVDRSFDGSIDLVVKRRSIPRNNYTTYALSSSINYLYKLRQILNAEVAAWFGITDYTATQFDALSILGFYKRFSIVVDQQDRVRLDLEIEEV